ncbi:copper transporter [Brachybacterium sp. YJGR34]|uniref:copper transporter n=1 Tax=Brachybacterium sp. YJGR34 TaxID=2059911 RepID=UPI000E0C0B3A|nr:copper transporter [Brachybacterium sp. YJGR34]
MIDFRYHLVSLISVFLALAVGIVLGAGPLRENLGDQLAGQVEQLRTEQEQLRTDAEELAAQNDQLASFITELGPDLVQGTLEGDRVAVLSDDSSIGPVTDRVQGLLEDAGAATVIRIELQPALWEPGQEDSRAVAFEEISAIAPVALQNTDLSAAEQLSALIPALLRPVEGSELTPELRSQIWEVLVDHRLVSIEGEMPAEMDGVVYASAAPEELAEESEDDELATERAQGLLASQTSLLGALAGAGVPSVVSAATPGNDASTGILRTVRGDRAYDALSTTDRLQEADGPLLSVLALLEQTRGGSGAYGTTADAEDRLPPLPETEGLEDQAAQQGAGDEAAPGEDGESAPSDGGGEG